MLLLDLKKEEELSHMMLQMLHSSARAPRSLVHKVCHAKAASVPMFDS